MCCIINRSFVFAFECSINIGYCCLNARVEDYARMGQFYLQDGIWDGQRLVPEGWVEQATRPNAPFQEAGPAAVYPHRGYGLHFWVPEEHDGEYFMAGVYGQYVWVDERRHIVIARTAADLTWGLILAVTRRLGEAERVLRDGRFRGWALDMLLGSGIQGRQLGVIGYGRIGRAVARRAAGFGMSVAYSATEELVDPDPPAIFMPLEELLSTSHVVSLHAPMSKANHHLIDEERLRRMPVGSFLINTARGPLVDEAALVRVLEEGHLGGAGLDVFEEEPAVHPGLLERENVVLLPHIGSATQETRAAMAELAAKNILAVLAGEEPPTPVVRP